MDTRIRFADLLQEIDHLPVEAQETLVEIVRRRIAERGRERVVADVEDSRREFEEGRCRAATADELMDELLS